MSRWLAGCANAHANRWKGAARGRVCGLEWNHGKRRGEGIYKLVHSTGASGVVRAEWGGGRRL